MDKVHFHGFSDSIKGMLTGGVEVPLHQLQILATNLHHVALGWVDLHSMHTFDTFQVNIMEPRNQQNTI